MTNETIDTAALALRVADDITHELASDSIESILPIILCFHDAEARALAALLRGVVWQPIETAPKDGTKFDGWARDERVTNVYWSTIQNSFCTDGMFGPEEPTPLPFYPGLSHWMPLPSPPLSTTKEG